MTRFHRFLFSLIICITLLTSLYIACYKKKLITSQNAPALHRNFVDQNEQNTIYEKVAIKNDGSMVAAGYGRLFTDTPKITVWDLHSAKILRYFLPTNQNNSSVNDESISVFAFSAKENNMAMVNNNIEVTIRSITTGNLKHSLRPGIGTIYFLKYSDDGKMLACIAERIVAIYDLASDKKPLLIRADRKMILDVDFSTDNKFLVSVGRERKASLWLLSNGNFVNSHHEHAADIHACAYIKGTSKIATIDQNGIQVLWDTKNNKTKKITTVIDRLTAVSFSPDGQYYVRGVGAQNLSGQSSRKIEVKSSITGTQLVSIVTEGSVSTLGISDNKYIVAGDGLSKVQVWKVP